MRKIYIITLFSILAAGMVWADQGPTDEDYRNLDQLREKVVRMQREMNKIMRDVVGPYANTDNNGAGIFAPDIKVDVSENAKNVIVRADLPGMSKDQIDITLQDNRILRLSGSRDVMTRQESPGVVKQERMTGHFERSLELPAECENSGIKATYNEGVLEIVLPKKKGAKEDTVKVNVQ